MGGVLDTIKETCDSCCGAGQEPSKDRFNIQVVGAQDPPKREDVAVFPPPPGPQMNGTKAADDPPAFGSAAEPEAQPSERSPAAYSGAPEVPDMAPLSQETKKWDLDGILRDPEGADAELLRQLFDTWVSPSLGVVTLDGVAPLQSFCLESASGLSDTAFSEKLFHVLDGNGNIDFWGFQTLVSETAVNQQEVIETFMKMNPEHDAISAFDARTALRTLGERLELTDGEWDVVLDALMQSADFSVSLDSFLMLYGRLQTIARAYKLAKTANT
ncbi:unnamed protein product [Vitrella brassicaformis CCMP3155]|uniref:EF-hand domain-containing protein n=1 Tax=Vitrella brassicaformis (strain CCMP3155) TaxID=1169540 RepID=A0A0G4FCU1_VITBC|nr:unnamed protein product [Vitrella brassicaformis CCMP3155]|eukprot:CEM10975.1 unnamed protein product [Vitrella brassicaformis CCMP3155]